MRDKHGKPRTNPLTGTVVMEPPPREEEAPMTQVISAPPAAAPAPFPIQGPGHAGPEKRIPWKETRDDVKPAAHAFSSTMIVEPPRTEVRPEPPPPAPAPPPIQEEELLPPSDPWGARLPPTHYEAPPQAPPPAPKRANPRTGMMKSLYGGQPKKR